MIADDSIFGERKMTQSLMADHADKKTPPGGERFRGGANKGTGILRMETFVPRQLVKIISNHRAKVMSYVRSAVNSCFGRGLGVCRGSGRSVRSVPLVAQCLGSYREIAAKVGHIAVPFVAQSRVIYDNYCLGIVSSFSLCLKSLPLRPLRSSMR